MIQIPYEKLVNIISEQSGLKEDEINAKVDGKLKQLSGLISKEGAAHIIANELKVKITQETSGKIDIKDLLEGMRNVEVVGKLLNKFEVREFSVGARSGKVGNLILGDSTGRIRATVWNEMTSKINDMNVGDVIKVESCYTKLNNNNIEVHINDSSEITINPEGVTIDDVPAPVVADVKRKRINEITADDFRTEVFGNVVQLFNPTFFEVCPTCGKRIKEKEGAYNCEEHGAVEPSWAYIINFILDDGTETMRVVCFRNTAETLIGVKPEEFQDFRGNIELFDTVKEKMLGKQIVVNGRVKKNTMFDRLEIIAEGFDLKPDVSKEIDRLKNEMENSS